MAWKDTEQGKEWMRKYNRERYTKVSSEERNRRYRQWYAKAGSKKRVTARQRKAYAENRGGMREKHAAAREKRLKDDAAKINLREYMRGWKHKNKFGLVDGEYDRMFEKQDGVCAICRKPETRKVRGIVVALSVDHDHETGRVRGLLCQSCNQAIGLMQDDPTRLLAAASYLSGKKTRSRRKAC